jgi:hypothetical protein
LNRLPQEFIDILMQPLENTPSGLWSDFNTMHRDWDILYRGSVANMWEKNDVPPEPQVSDYPEL